MSQQTPGDAPAPSPAAPAAGPAAGPVAGHDPLAQLRAAEKRALAGGAPKYHEKNAGM